MYRLWSGEDGEDGRWDGAIAKMFGAARFIEKIDLAPHRADTRLGSYLLE